MDRVPPPPPTTTPSHIYLHLGRSTTYIYICTAPYLSDEKKKKKRSMFQIRREVTDLNNELPSVLQCAL